MQLVLTTKAQKLMKLCEIEGYKNAHDLMEAVWCDSVCPAICMTEGCDYTQYHVQRRGYGLRFKPGAGDGRKSSRTRIGCGEPKLGMNSWPLIPLIGSCQRTWCGRRVDSVRSRSMASHINCLINADSGAEGAGCNRGLDRYSCCSGTIPFLLGRDERCVNAGY